MKRNSKKLVSAAVCLALCMVLPLLTGQIPQIGKALSPMHIPVLLCGFIAGPWYAAIVGAAAPLMRFAIFGMPKIFPTGIAMCFELAAYGAVSGAIYKLFGKKPWSVYASLIIAMLTGRVIWGIASAVIMSGTETPFTFAAFIAGAFTNAVPGIILHIAIIPIIVIALERAGLMQSKSKSETT